MAYNHCKSCGEGIDCMSQYCICCQGKFVGKDYCQPPILRHHGVLIDLPQSWPAFEEAFANCVYGRLKPKYIAFYYDEETAEKAIKAWEEHRNSERHKISRDR